MDDASSPTPWPNPLRTLLLLIAAIAIFAGYAVWVGGTGGLDPADLDPEVSKQHTTWTIGWILSWMLGPLILLLPVALIAATWRAGWRHTKSGLRFALGSGDPRRMPGAARFWATAARITAWGGVMLGVAGAVAVETILHRRFWLGHDSGSDAYADQIWEACAWANHAPIVGILFGRIVFGLLADGARIRAGEPRSEPVFSRMQDLALAALVGIPWYLLLFMTWRFTS